MNVVDVFIREATTEDRNAILDVLRDAFRQDDEALIVERLWAADAIDPEYVAEVKREIIGYCAFSPITTDPLIGGLLLGLAPVAVKTRYQRSGAGSVLVNKGLEICKERNARLIVVLGEPDYYSHFGFEPASTKNMRWSVMDAGDAFQAIDLAGVADGKPYTIDYHPAFTAA